MNDLIATREAIIAELKTMQSFLEESMSEEADEAILRGNDLAVYMARSGKLLADAKYYRDMTLNSGVVAEMKTLLSLPASSANKYIDTLCKEDTYLMNWADRINRSATHQMEWCRTVVSKAKAEMNAFNQQPR